MTTPGDDVDCVSRVFTARIGIVEDQVTGTARTALGPFWAGRLGRTKLAAVQASQRRGVLDFSQYAEEYPVTGCGDAVTAGAALAPFREANPFGAADSCAEGAVAGIVASIRNLS